MKGGLDNFENKYDNIKIKGFQEDTKVKKYHETRTKYLRYRIKKPFNKILPRKDNICNRDKGSSNNRNKQRNLKQKIINLRVRGAKVILMSRDGSHHRP